MRTKSVHHASPEHQSLRDEQIVRGGHKLQHAESRRAGNAYVFITLRVMRFVFPFPIPNSPAWPARGHLW
jgi:hypothetical protein